MDKGKNKTIGMGDMPDVVRSVLEKKRVLREGDKIEAKKQKEALPKQENVDLNFIFSTLREMEKRNIERHKETVHILTEENKTLHKKLAEFEKKHVHLEEMIKNIKNRVNISLDEDLNHINNSVCSNAESIIIIEKNIKARQEYNLKEMRRIEESIKSKIGGVASSVHAKIRTNLI